MRVIVTFLIAVFMATALTSCKARQDMSTVLDGEEGGDVRVENVEVAELTSSMVKDAHAIESAAFPESTAMSEREMTIALVTHTKGYILYGDVPEANGGGKLVKRPLGFVLYEVAGEGSYSFVYNVAVHPDFQRLNLGRTLMNYLHTQSGLEGSVLVVSEQNTEARRFFQDVGYEESLALKKYYSDSKKRAVVMTDLELSESEAKDFLLDILNETERLGEAKVSSKEIRSAEEIERELAEQDSKGFNQKQPFATVAKSYGELSKRYINLTAQVQTGMPPFEVTDRAAIRKLRLALRKHEIGNIVLLGDAGSGKTKLVEGFAYEVSQGLIPEIHRNTPIFSIDAATLGAGTSNTGTFEKRVNAILKVADQQPIILFIDEIHSLAGQGTHRDNSNDFFEFIKTYLADGRIRVIGTSTEFEFNDTFGGREALFTRFEQYHKKPMTREQVVQAIHGWHQRFEIAKITDKMAELLIDLSEKYDPIGGQPRKVSRLIDHMYSLKDLNPETAEQPITEEFVKNVATKKYQLSELAFDRQEQKQRIIDMPDQLGQRFFQRDQAIKTLQDYTKQSFLNLGNTEQPRMRLLFAGPRGTAKTQLAKAYAGYMGLPWRLIEMNGYDAMSNRTAEDMLREIAEQIRKNGECVLILDEIEKAHPTIQNRLLSALQDGYFFVKEKTREGDREGKAIRVSLRNARVIMTTNAGQDAVREGVVDSQELNERIEREGLISEFLLDRTQEVVAFEPPRTKKQFGEILSGHLDVMISEFQAAPENPKLDIKSKQRQILVDQLVEQHYQDGQSPREAIEDLERRFTDIVTEELYNQSGEDGECKLLKIKFEGRG